MKIGLKYPWASKYTRMIRAATPWLYLLCPGISSMAPLEPDVSYVLRLRTINIEPQMLKILRLLRQGPPPSPQVPCALKKLWEGRQGRRAQCALRRSNGDMLRLLKGSYSGCPEGSGRKCGSIWILGFSLDEWVWLLGAELRDAQRIARAVISDSEELLHDPFLQS